MDSLKWQRRVDTFSDFWII